MSKLQAAVIETGRSAALRYTSRKLAARARIFAACKANKIFFLNSMNPNNVIDMIKEGVMVGPASQQTAEIGRKFTNRQMPW